MTSYLPWVFYAGGKIRARPLVSDGVAYFGTEEGYLYAAPIGAWDEKWRFETSGKILSTPALEGGVLYFGSADGYFYALDASNRELLWRFESGGPIVAAPALLEHLVLFGTLDGTFHALDRSGKEIWSVPARAPVSRQAVVAGDLVSFSDESGSAFVLKAATGEIIYASDQPRADTATVLSGDLVIFGSDSRLLAIDLSSALPAWEFPVYHEEISDPLLVEGIVCFGAGNYLYALDAASGMLKWELAIGSFPVGTPAVSEGTIFLTTRKKGILAVDLDTGRQWWSFDAGAEEMSPPLAVGNWLFAGSSDGNFYGYELQQAHAETEAQAGSQHSHAAAFEQQQPPHMADHLHGRIFSNAQAPWHLYPLILLSFNIFHYYWFFRNWRYFNIMGIRSLRPGWRLVGLLSPALFVAMASAGGGMVSVIMSVEPDELFFDFLLGGTVICYILSLYLMYDQFRMVRNLAREEGVRSFPLFIVVSAFFSLQNMASVISNVWGELFGITGPGAVLVLAALSVVFFVLSVFVLAQVQKTINRIWEQRFPQIPVRRNFTSGEKVLMVIFGSLSAIVMILLPLSLVATA